MKPQEVMETLRISQSTLRRLRKEGKIKQSVYQKAIKDVIG
ncbi:helix-turn-helix domain-containing protein [Sulfurihydrogenibium subterraneum]